MDWEGLKRIAFGPLNLKPGEFGQLTHAEFLELLEGYQWRERAEWRKLAQLASWITAPHLKKPVSPDKLLKEKKEKKKTNQTESRGVVVDLMARMGMEGGKILGDNSGNVC